MSTKKLQIIGSLMGQAQDADTVDGKHASDFASATDVEGLKVLVGDTSVSEQIGALANTYLPLTGGQVNGEIAVYDEQNGSMITVDGRAIHFDDEVRVTSLSKDELPTLSINETYDVLHSGNYQNYVTDELYIQADEPIDAPDGSIWVDVDEEAKSLTAEDVGAATKEYVDEAIASIDIPEIDLTGYATENFVEEYVYEALLPETSVPIEDYTVIEYAYLNDTKIVNMQPSDNMTGYNLHCYPVHTGEIYRIRGDNVRYNIAVTLAMFDTALVGGASGVSGDEVILVDGSAAQTATNYDIDFKAPCDGYIIVACDPKYPTLQVETYVEESELPKTPLKIQVFGDSMTDNTWDNNRVFWVDILPRLLQDYELTLVNSAVGGNTLAKFDYEGLKGIAWQMGLTEATVGSKGNIYAPLELDNDLVIVWGGANDWGGGVKKLGDNSVLNPLIDLADIDITSVYGALRCIIETVSKTGQKLMLITPLQRYNEADQNRDVDENGNVVSSGGFTLTQVADAVIECGSYYGIPVVDMYRTSGINRFNLATYTSDMLHANNLGAEILAKEIAQAIKNPPLGNAIVTHVPQSLSLTNAEEYTPTNDYHPATKKYVDDAVALVASSAPNQPEQCVYTEFAGSYIEKQGYPHAYSSTAFITHRYVVSAGVTYNIFGEAVRWHLAGYPLALFTEFADIDAKDDNDEYLKGTILIGGDTSNVETNYNIKFTPCVDGYIWIAAHTNYTCLTVNSDATASGAEMLFTNGILLASSTMGSQKRFLVTVNDNGTLTATEYTG